MRNNGVTKLDYYGLNYQDYLQSAHWRQVRLEALDRAGNKCQLCSRKQTLEVHHNTYENLGCELPEDLIVLCDDCHTKHHKIIITERNDGFLWLLSRFGMMHMLLKYILVLMKKCGQTHESEKNPDPFYYMDCFDTGLSSPISAVMQSVVERNEIWINNPNSSEAGKRDFNSYMEQEIRKAWTKEQLNINSPVLQGAKP